MKLQRHLFLTISLLVLPGTLLAARSPDYNKQVAPILRKYCAGCHNAEDREGELVLDSYRGILQGGENGAVVTAGQGKLSRLIRVLTGKAEPAMPPEDNEGPSAGQIEILRAWIDAGAKGPDGAEPDPTILVTPQIKPSAPVRQAISALAISPDGKLVATAGYGRVLVRSLSGNKPVHVLEGHRGNINAVSFSADGKYLIAAAGQPGLLGEARLWNVRDGKLLKVFQGHKDSLYAAQLSPDGKLLATGSYDKLITIWDVTTVKPLRTLKGHNGAVFDLAFRPDGKVLASASGDRTVKLWNVADGTRLATFSESLKQLYTLAFHPDGTRLAAGGADNRIRVWKISPSAKEGTNLLLVARFAHEGPILRLTYSPDGHTLVSTAEDRLIKAWDARQILLRKILPVQPDWSPSLAVGPDNKTLLVGRMDGSTASYQLPSPTGRSGPALIPLAETPEMVQYSDQPPLDQLPKTAEVEPNDVAQQATALQVPGIGTGKIAIAEAGKQIDVDLFRFEARAGGQWIVETKAARDKSPLDSKIEVLHEDGRPVKRLLLRAVRNSEVTFRAVSSGQLGIRLTNWEEMELNQYLYLNGEVIKIYRMPRGPDSGFDFYPGSGQRHGYFDTSAQAHALFSPSYIVEPHAVGSGLPNNGLPVFTLNYENDDGSKHTLGKDSRLMFTAPADGSYLVRVRDVRDLVGENFHYQLIVRRPRPDFQVTLEGAKPTVNAGSGKTFTVKVLRHDNFNGPVRVDIAGLPPGFHGTTPLFIEAGHYQARGVISALPNAPQPTEENWSHTKVTATATIAGHEVVHPVNDFGRVKLTDKPKLIVSLGPIAENAAAAKQDSGPAEQTSDASLAFPLPHEIVIAPGTTSTCRLKISRQGFDGPVELLVNNLPHGVIVENLGLNGVTILAGQTERTLYLRAADWVPQTSRLFYAQTKSAEGKQASLPMLLHVRRPGKTAQIGAR